MPGQRRDTPSPPTPVAVSFWLFVASGVVLVAGFGYTLLRKQELVDALVEINTDQSITREQIEAGATNLLWTLFVGAIVFAVLFGLFAWKAREGARSARTVLTVLAAVTLIFQMVLFNSLITLAAVFLAVVGTVLLWLPSVRQYFPKAGRSLR